MLSVFMLILKLVIGGAISYVLPSVVVDSLDEDHHLKISWVGIISTSMFAVSIQLNQESSAILSAACILFIGFIAYSMSDGMKDTERIILYSCAVIGLFIGFGYIFQGIILSFLVYYITINKSDLFSLLNSDDDSGEENNNKLT